jgi:glutaredoxin
MQVKVYSVPACAPCTTLKCWLKENNVAFEEVSAGDLPEDEFQRITEEILSASKIGQRSFPAVCVVGDFDEEYWVSNHGQENIAEMKEAIMNAIRWAY